MKSNDTFGVAGTGKVVIAGTVIQKESQFLLVQERQPKAYKLWCLPAGKLDAGETAADAAIRETREETGFEVEIIRPLLLDYPAGDDRPMLNSFEAKIVEGTLQFAKDELFDARFFKFTEIYELNRAGLIRHEWIMKSIEMAR